MRAYKTRLKFACSSFFVVKGRYCGNVRHNPRFHAQFGGFWYTLYLVNLRPLRCGDGSNSANFFCESGSKCDHAIQHVCAHTGTPLTDRQSFPRRQHRFPIRVPKRMVQKKKRCLIDEPMCVSGKLSGTLRHLLAIFMVIELLGALIALRSIKAQTCVAPVVIGVLLSFSISLFQPVRASLKQTLQFKVCVEAVRSLILQKAWRSCSESAEKSISCFFSRVF